jgi:hypothetical protein
MPIDSLCNYLRGRSSSWTHERVVGPAAGGVRVGDVGVTVPPEILDERST